MINVPLVDLGLQHHCIAEEVRRGWAQVIARRDFVLGADVGEFEREYAVFTHVGHCVGVANGTDALELALRAIGVGPGDEVIVPTNSFVASALAVRRTGAAPALVDVDPEHLLIEPEAVAARIGPRVRAIMPVHLFGQVAPMREIAALATASGCTIVEDAAQAQGATQDGVPAGAFGTVGGTSFYPGKNLGAYGDAGAVLTSDEAIAARVRSLRNYGSDTKYEHPEPGFNSRLDTLQAVVLRAKLRRLAEWNRERCDSAVRYDDLLADLEEVRRPTTRAGNGHIWHLYVVRVPGRDAVLRSLHEQGIAASIHYPLPIHLQGAFADLGHRPGDFPVAERAASEILSLPIFPGITAAQQESVARALRLALRGSRGPK
jgi:dTDP-4-amino-4,6-dideoxygalactose transaminase